MDATKLYKAMWDVSRTPKPWEVLHAEWESFKQFAEGVPESTQEALIPLLWHARDRLQYLDGGGLNGHLKEHGLTKAGWKRICSLSIEETVELYRVYQVQRDWLAGVPAVVQLCADAAAPATAKGIQVLMNVPFGQVEELPKVLQQERYLLVRKAVEHAQELGQVELEGFRQQLLMMLDYIDVEGSPSRTALPSSCSGRLLKPGTRRCTICRGGEAPGCRCEPGTCRPDAGRPGRLRRPRIGPAGCTTPGLGSVRWRVRPDDALHRPQPDLLQSTYRWQRCVLQLQTPRGEPPSCDCRTAEAS